MATSWPTTARTKYGANKALRESWFADLARRQEVLAREPAFVLGDTAAWTTASGSIVTLKSWVIALPTHSRSLNLAAQWYAQVSGGASALVQLFVDSTAGDNDTTIPASYGWTDVLRCACPASGSTITVALKGYITAGAGTLSVDHTTLPLAAWFED